MCLPLLSSDASVSAPDPSGIGLQPHGWPCIFGKCSRIMIWENGEIDAKKRARQRKRRAGSAPQTTEPSQGRCTSTSRCSLHSHLIHSASCSPPTRPLRAPRSRPFWDSARTPPHTRHRSHALPGAHQCPRGVFFLASSPGSTSRIVDTWSFSPLATLDCGVVPRAEWT